MHARGTRIHREDDRPEKAAGQDDEHCQSVLHVRLRCLREWKSRARTTQTIKRHVHDMHQRPWSSESLRPALTISPYPVLCSSDRTHGKPVREVYGKLVFGHNLNTKAKHTDKPEQQAEFSGAYVDIVTIVK